ncbi:MAG: glutamate 5-kinase [Alphaproteobacteria bacterium]
MTGAAETDLATARRIVVKIGSALLVDGATGALRRDWMDALCEDIAACRANGQEIVLVSSGAVALGRKGLGIAAGMPRSEDLARLEEKQAAAAIGQIRLAHGWQDCLAGHGTAVAQVLLTLTDTEERRRHLNARNTLDTLLALGAVPVINENDTVATDEIRFGDNDRLAARVAQMIGADTLVLLSDVDGLYTADPRHDASAKLVPELREITSEIEAMAGAAPAGHSSGGMVTKLAAARIAMGAGCRMVLADGRVRHPLRAIADGARCTWFLSAASPLTARKKWIAGALETAGAITVDDGALAALGAGKSLLPAGVLAVEGDFSRGDAVLLRGGDGRLAGKGLTAYSAADARRIMGHKSGEIEAILGYRGRDEVIHRDDLVLE